MERMELDFPVEELEPSAVPALPHDGCVAGACEVEGACHRLAAGRAAISTGASSMSASFGPRCRFRIRRTLLKLLQLDLETHPPSAAIVGLELHAQSAAPYRAQHGLFLPQAPEPGQIRSTARATAEAARRAACRFAGVDRRSRPNAFRMVPFAPPPPVEEREAVALGAYRSARLPSAASGRRCTRRNSTRAGLLGRAAVCRPRDAGPWRVSGQWWSEANWCREEWDVRLANGDRGTCLPHRLRSSLPLLVCAGDV